MKKFTYRKVDAFTSGKSRGNPAAYLLTGPLQLTENEMLAIAQEHKGFVSEVVFCSDSDLADIKLTYFSSECEVDFCGHGTVATMYDLIKSNGKLRSKSEITIETNRKGLLTVYNRIGTDDAVYITAPPGTVAADNGFTGCGCRHAGSCPRGDPQRSSAWFYRRGSQNTDCPYS